MGDFDVENGGSSGRKPKKGGKMSRLMVALLRWDGAGSGNGFKSVSGV